MNRERTSGILSIATVVLAVVAWLAYTSALALPYRLSPAMEQVFHAAIFIQIIAPLGAVACSVAAGLISGRWFKVTRLAMLASLFELSASAATLGIHSSPAQIPATRTEIQRIHSTLDRYRGVAGSFPSEAEGLAVLVPKWMAHRPEDAWGNPFRYRLVEEKPIIRSAGPDGKFDTRDDLE